MVPLPGVNSPSRKGFKGLAPRLVEGAGKDDPKKSAVLQTGDEIFATS